MTRRADNLGFAKEQEVKNLTESLKKTKLISLALSA